MALHHQGEPGAFRRRIARYQTLRIAQLQHYESEGVADSYIPRETAHIGVEEAKMRPRNDSEREEAYGLGRIHKKAGNSPRAHQFV